MIHPTISILTDLDSGIHSLMAASYGMTAAAGPRLFRKEPHPRISFQHEDLNLAQADAKTLQEYINETWATKTISKKKLRKLGAD